MSLIVPGVRIQAKLAEGGSSVIYHATDLKSNQPRAVKFLNARAKADGKMVKAFAAEAALLQELEHEGLIKLYASGESGDDHYMVLELFPGKNLKRRLQEQDPTLPDHALEIFHDVSEAVCYLHLNGVIHKDIKPENILVSDAGKVKLIDLSIAERPGFLSSLGLFKRAVQGTPSYMSPEQIQGKTLDHRTDIYSLGATMYELYTGAPPFVGRRQEEIFEKHLHERPHPLTAANPHVPSEIDRLILEMLEKDPAQRVPDMNMLIFRLSRIKPAAAAVPGAPSGAAFKGTQIMVRSGRISYVRVGELEKTGMEQTCSALLTNLSRAGLGLSTATPPNVGDFLDMQVVVPPLRDALHMVGKVLWANPTEVDTSFSVGVMLTQKPPDYAMTFELLKRALRAMH